MNSIISRLHKFSQNTPDKLVFAFLSNNIVKKSLTYRCLLEVVKNLAKNLDNYRLRNKTVVLIYENPDDFIISFLACMYIGAIPVPTFPIGKKKNQDRNLAIIQDSKTELVLTTSSLKKYFNIDQELTFTQWFCTDLLNNQDVDPVEMDYIENDIAFIQYTSGTTGKPKGVVVSSEGLLDNLQLISEVFDTNTSSKILTWLPFQHDMGLVGNILQTIYIGCTCYIMSPNEFIQIPYLWLKAIHKYNITHSGGPNFTYDRCIERVSQNEIKELNLRSWIVAINGAERVRHTTLHKFIEKFSAAGFDKSAFRPCYGLAEATLLVSGGQEKGGSFIEIEVDDNDLKCGKVRLVGNLVDRKQTLIGSGKIGRGMDVLIIPPDRELAVGEDIVGEICISGKSVTKGYWGETDEDNFISIDGNQYLRTGDLGFIHKKELFVNSRCKEMVIVRGKNVYFVDVEESVREIQFDFPVNAAIAFSIEGRTSENLIVMLEISRMVISDLNAIEDLQVRIKNKIINDFEIIPFDIVVGHPMSIPRTTSGKVQRYRCRELYLEGKLNRLGTKTKQSSENRGPVPEIFDSKALTDYLSILIVGRKGLSFDVSLQELAIDSLKSIELINTINRTLDISLDTSSIFKYETFGSLVDAIEEILWLKNAPKEEGGITV